MAAWVDVLTVSGVTLVPRLGSSYAMPNESGGGTSAATLGTDYSVSGGIITILSATGNALGFYFHDTGGTLAACPEYPAISARVMLDVSGMTLAGYIDDYIKCASPNSNIVNANDTLTDTYTGGNLACGISRDGSFSGQALNGATLRMQVFITAAASNFWIENVNCVES